MTRRAMLQRAANGFGALAFTALAADGSLGGVVRGGGRVRGHGSGPHAPRASHFAARADNVIFLYADGGPSQVDTFDPKPLLERDHGRPFRLAVEQTQFDSVGAALGSPWRFHRRGRSGLPVSELFPRLGECADDLCVLRSMTSKFAEHTRANYFLHTGHGLQGRPSIGAWAVYGLGSECRDLPGFVVLNGGFVPPGGLDCFHSGFLPPTYQSSMLKHGENPIADLHSAESPRVRERKRALLRRLDAESVRRGGSNDAIESSIQNHELAFAMQMAVPDLLALGGETRATRELYGLDAPTPEARAYARQCLLARRLVERGVRFVEVTYMQPNGFNRWDQHKDLRDGHARNAEIVDRPIAGLLKDLKSRGLLERTLVVWGGEFGRTPFAQGTNDGRDHSPHGFSMWLAGGGVRGGTTYGATDDYGYRAVENPLEIHDLHATILHLLGIDHEKLTYRHSGRDFRLTDVHGRVVREVIA
jgi:hypothetical protein